MDTLGREDSGTTVGDARFDQHTRADRPGADESLVAGDPPDIGGGGLLPETAAVGESDAIDVSVVGSKQNPVAGNCGCEPHGATSGEGPQQSATG